MSAKGGCGGWAAAINSTTVENGVVATTLLLPRDYHPAEPTARDVFGSASARSPQASTVEEGRASTVELADVMRVLLELRSRIDHLEDAFMEAPDSGSDAD